MKLGEVIRDEYPGQTRIVGEMCGDTVLQIDHKVLLHITFRENQGRIFDKESLGKFIKLLQGEYEKLEEFL